MRAGNDLGRPQRLRRGPAQNGATARAIAGMTGERFDRPAQPMRHARVDAIAQPQGWARHAHRGLGAPTGNSRLVQKQAEIAHRGPARALRRISRQDLSADAPKSQGLDQPASADRAAQLVKPRVPTVPRTAEPKIRAGQRATPRVRAGLSGERTDREPTRHAGRTACAARRQRTALAARPLQRLHPRPGATNRREASAGAAEGRTRLHETPNRALVDSSARHAPAPRAQITPGGPMRSP